MGWVKIQDQAVCCLREIYFSVRDPQSEGIEKDIPCKWKSKEIRSKAASGLNCIETRGSVSEKKKVTYFIQKKYLQPISK